MSEIRDIVTAVEYRHIPTGSLAILAQRQGRVFAAPSTWYRLVNKHGWRRPRIRVHPPKPKVGIRASGPNEVWHVDATVVRLIDGTKAYVHALIDNYSRKILAWRAASRQIPEATASMVLEAIAGMGSSKERPSLLTDGGGENYGSELDELIESGKLTRLLAMTDVIYSNSMIESWWRSLKHNWLFLNQLDSVTGVKKLVEFYVHEHNRVIPHPAFDGRTPDEVYLGTGQDVARVLARERTKAKGRRLEKNRATTCPACV